MNATSAAPRFASLGEMQETHTTLVKEVSKNTLANLDRITRFVQKGVATGAVLDAPSDRVAAQSLINFWTVRLASGGQESKDEGTLVQEPEVEDTLLAEFSPSELVATVVTPADKWWEQQTEIGKTLARRILLRLVRLEEDGNFVVLPRTGSVCDDLVPRELAEHILAELVRLGVVRITHNSVGTDEVTLRSPEVMRGWPRLRQWLADRKSFREKANEWARRRAEKEAEAPSRRSILKRIEETFRAGIIKFGSWVQSLWRAFPTAPARLAGDEAEYEEAETYRDRNAAELKLIYQKRQLDKQRDEWNQVLTGLMVVAAVVFIALFVWAIRGWTAADDSAKKEAKARKDAEAATKFANEETRRANDEAALTEKWQQAVYRSREALKLANMATRSRFQQPQKSLLLAVEAFGIVENEMAKLEKEGTSKQLQGLRDSAHESRNSVQEALRLTLGNIGGTGYSAEIGKITQLAAYEEKTDKDKSGLRYLAAAGSWGKICLWHIDDKGKYTRTILPFGYAPPIRKLLFTDSGKYLVAHHLRDNVTVWDLTTKDLECRLFEAFPEPREPGLGPAVPGSLFSSSTGKWLEIDDGQSAGMLIHLEDAKAGPRRFDLGLQQIVKAEKPAPVLKYHSFSDDEKWFARITSTGEVYVWDLAALKDGVNRPPVKLQQDAKEKHEPNVQAVNGEFLDKSKRLVVYLGNGRARYWDLNGTSTWGKAEEVNLQTVAGIDVLQKVDTNGRGTHAILIGSAKREKAPNSSSEVVAVCFDGKDLQAGPVRGKQLQDYDWPYHRGRPEIDRTGRWLIVPCASPGKNDRILAWDLGPGEPEGRAAVPRKPQSTSFPGSILEARRVPHSPCLVTRGLGNTIHWLNLLQSQSLLELRGHDAQVTVLAYSQDGRWLVTGSDDGTVRAWNLNPLSPSAEPVVFGASAPQSIRVAPNKRWAALSLPDGSLRFARIIDGTLPKEWIRHRAEKPKGAASLVWSDDGRWLLEHRPESGTASLWDVAGKQPSRTGKRELGITKTVTGMLVNKAGTRLAVQSTNGILLWNLKEHAPHCCALPEAAGTVLAFVSPGDRLLTYDEKAVKVWDLAGQAPQPTSVVSTKDRIKIAHALASADGMRLVIWEKVEDADKLQASLITELREENRRLLQFLQTKDGVFFSPNGEFLGCEAVPPPGSQAQLSFPRYWYIGKLPSDGPIIMHEFRTGDGAAGKAGEALARSPNGKWFVTREGGDAFLWDLLQKPNLAKQFQRSRGLGEVRSAQFTSDSAWLITAGASTISVYDLRQQTRGPQWKLQTTQPQDTIACVALTLTESRSLLAIVVQKDGDTSTTVWDLGKPGNQRPIVLGGGFRPSPPTEMMFNSDATRIVSFFPDRLLVSYCDPDELKARTAIVVGRKLSKDEQKVIDELAEMTPGPDRLSGGELSGQGKFGPTLLKDKLLGKLPAFLPGFNKTETLTSADRELGPQSKPARAYKINMAAKSTYLIDMRSPKFEAYFILKDPDNQVVAWADERGSPPARLGYLCPKSGEYTIVATVFGGGVGEFHLTVAELKPMEPTALIPLGPQGGDIRGHLSTDNDDTGDGPGLVYALQLPKGKLCQLDLTSSTFAPILRLVGDASGAIVADAGNVAGRARIVLNSRQGGAYRVLVIGTRGAPGPFDLRVTLRDPGQ